MPRPRKLFCIGWCCLLGACSVAGEDAAKQWVQSRTHLVAPIDSSVVPKLVDTPPAVFTAKHVADPFASDRIGQSMSSRGDAQLGLGNRWWFADAPADSLRIVGFVQINKRYIGVIEGNDVSANVKVGDRLGNQQSEIVEISKQGIRLRQMDQSESWMPIGRRSH